MLFQEICTCEVFLASIYSKCFDSVCTLLSYKSLEHLENITDFWFLLLKINPCLYAKIRIVATIIVGISTMHRYEWTISNNFFTLQDFPIEKDSVLLSNLTCVTDAIRNIHKANQKRIIFLTNNLTKKMKVFKAHMPSSFGIIELKRESFSW